MDLDNISRFFSYFFLFSLTNKIKIEEMIVHAQINKYNVSNSEIFTFIFIYTYIISFYNNNLIV